MTTQTIVLSRNGLLTRATSYYYAAILIHEGWKLVAVRGRMTGGRKT